MDQRHIDIQKVYLALNKAEQPGQDALNVASAANAVENPILEGEYSDFVYQMKHDERMQAMLPRVIEILSCLKFVPAFVTPEEKKEIDEANQKLAVKICKLAQECEMPYALIETFKEEMGNLLLGPINMACRVMGNTTVQAMLHCMVKKQDTKELTIGDIGRYVEANMKVRAEEKTEESTAPTAEPVVDGGQK